MLQGMEDVNVRDKHGKTLLHYYVEQNDHEMVSELLKLGASLRCADENKLTPWGCTTDVTMKSLLVSLMALHHTWMEDVNYKGFAKQTLLHLEIDPVVAHRLLANGADVNARDEDGKTPLHYPKSADFMTLLIGKGPDINAADLFGTTPLHTTADLNSVWNRSNKDELESKQKLLIKNGANVNAQDFDGRTALHCLCALPCKHVLPSVFRFLQAGANPHILDNYGKTPLHYTNNGFVVRCLIGAGACPDIKDQTGKKPVDYANSSDVKKILSELIHKPVDYSGNISDKEDQGDDDSNNEFGMDC